ncbi:MAG: ATP-binding cassette domain-containing protein [Planctomycetes bacterium]|nr:ATP-binding cassette domain-containing protein [Planctomycetota bacterium]
MSAVEIQGVTKTFGTKVAVHDLSLVVPGGSVYGFIGPNGSGKSTTIRMIMRIFHPDRGQIRVLGEDATMGDAANDRIGYLPEERGLYRKMFIGELLEFCASLKGATNVKADIRRWLERLDLAGYEKKRFEALSKGMGQKVQFIASILHRPELLILDEPFSGLDPVNMEVLKDAILEVKQQGSTILFSTHDMDVAEKMCDFIFMIYNGRKVLDGTLDSIQNDYGSDTLRIRTAGNGVAYDRLPGVERVNDYGRFQELRMTRGADSQAILREIISKTKVEHFEVARPSLRDIFVRIAGPQEATHE